MHYKITWTIDIEADTPIEAARDALRIQRKVDSIATVFSWRDTDGHEGQVDLENPQI